MNILNILTFRFVIPKLLPLCWVGTAPPRASCPSQPPQMNSKCDSDPTFLTMGGALKHSTTQVRYVYMDSDPTFLTMGVALKHSTTQVRYVWI